MPLPFNVFKLRACVCICKYLSCKHIKFTVVGVASAYFKSFSLHSRVYLAHTKEHADTASTQCMCVCVCDEHVCKFM